MELQKLAQEVRKYFEDHPHKENTFRMKDEAPQWVRDMVFEAHEDFAPDDYKYNYVVEALDALASGDIEGETLEPEVYNYQLLNWLGSNMKRIGYVDEAREDCGPSEGIMQDIMMGQRKEKLEVFNIVRSCLEERAEEKEED